MVAKPTPPELGPLLDALPAAVVTTDADRLVVTWNRAATEVYGYTAEEATGRRLDELLRPSESPLVPAEIYARVELHETWQGEAVHLTKAGTRVWVEWTVGRCARGPDEAPGLMSVSRDITSRRKRDEALGSELTQLRLSLDAARVRAWQWHVARDVVTVDRPAAWTLISGSSGANFETFLAAVHPSDRDRVRRATLRALDESDALTLEFRAIRPDGSLAWIHTVARVQRDGQGRPLALLGISSDVTERKQAQVQLERDERHFRSLVANAPDGIAVIDAKGRFRYLSPAVETMLGRSPEQLLGTDYLTYCPEDHRDDRRAVFAKILESPGELVDGEVVLIHRDGSRRIMTFAARNLIDDPVVQGVVVNFRDITWRRQAETALRESEERYQALFDRSLDCVLVHDLDGQLLDANAAGLALLGYTREELPGVGLDSLLSPEQLPTALATLRDVFQHGRQQDTTEYTVTTRNGETRHLETRSTLIYRQGHPYAVLVMARDVTERHRLDHENRAYQQRLQALASQISLARDQEQRRVADFLHDHFASTLALARYRTSAIANSAAEGSATEQAAAELGELLDRLIGDVRALMVELNPPVLHHIGFGAAIRSLVDNLAIHRGLRCTMESIGEIPPLAEELNVVLFQGVREVIMNAVKHSQSEVLAVTLDATPTLVTAVVEDQGCGFVPEEALHRKVAEGGFGLFNAKERLAHLGGRLELSSRLGVGTRVIITLPLGRADNGALDEEGLPEDATVPRGPTPPAPKGAKAPPAAGSPKKPLPGGPKAGPSPSRTPKRGRGGTSRSRRTKAASRSTGRGRHEPTTSDPS